MSEEIRYEHSRHSDCIGILHKKLRRLNGAILRLENAPKSEDKNNLVFMKQTAKALRYAIAAMHHMENPLTRKQRVEYWELQAKKDIDYLKEHSK